MTFLQNKIIIALLATIAAVATYFMAADITKKRAIKKAEEQRRIERELKEKEWEKEMEEMKKNREERRRGSIWGQKKGESKYRRMMGGSEE